MNLYEITTGRCGESYERCLVVAESYMQAISLVKSEFLDRELHYEVVFIDLNKIHIGEFNDYSGY